MNAARCRSSSRSAAACERRGPGWPATRLRRGAGARSRPACAGRAGGGPFAGAVRALDAQIGLRDDVAHSLALRAMDQLGVLLAPMLPDAETIVRLVAPRALGLLAVATAFGGRPGVPESWDVTSARLRCSRPAQSGPRRRSCSSRSTARAVDAYLPEAVRRTGVAVTVRAPAGPSGRGSPTCWLKHRPMAMRLPNT